MTALFGVGGTLRREAQVTFDWRPEDVPQQIIDCTRRLGNPAAELVILAEGNTSVRLAGGGFAIKASGSSLATASAEDFVVGELDELVAVLEARQLDQDGLTALLSCGAGSEQRRASIETLVHVAALAAGAEWVAHTHPTAVVGLLSVAEAEELWAAPAFPDEAVVMGEPVWVPYEEPGLALGRAVHHALRSRLDRDGVMPRLVLLGNHGIVALGATDAEVEAVTAMAVKSARVRGIALGAGTWTPLDPARARKLAYRPDEVDRRVRLGNVSS